MTRSLTDELRSLPPGIHGEGDEFRGLAWPALEWLEREVRPGMRTLETGAGSSTLAFARGGAEHVAVTPSAGEEQRIRAQADRMGIDHSRVRFELGPSHEVLPRLETGPLDLVLVDGAHGFPYPMLDWWYTAPQLVVGGRLLLDDAYMPPVSALVDALRSQPGWDVEGNAGYRTAIVRKTADVIPRWDWEGERIGGRLSFRYLPPGERAVAAIRHRVFSTRAGLALVALARRRAGLRWKQTG
ncbi:MAG: class I SAM-dependent methyltransferase [Gaiellaceae bacterium]